MANGITRYYPQPKVVQLIFGQSLRVKNVILRQNGVLP